RRRRTEHLNRLLWFQGIAIGVALFYAFAFLPLSGFSVVAVLILGLGLIPLSPIIGFFIALRLGILLKQLAPQGPSSARVRLWPAVSLGFLAVCLAGMPKLVTHIGLEFAVSEDQETRNKGLRFLRAAGSDSVLLRACYPGGQNIFDWYNIFGHYVPREDAQDVYYRVTGVPFNAVKPPDIRSMAGSRMTRIDDWDFELGGDSVSARVGGLSLIESRWDSMIDAEAATVYTEWTLVFKNDSSQQREARAEIALPPEAVGSRLTLWIDGEEREAAYNAKSKVKAAYKSVVRRRRDPVLATVSGPGQIMMQCFPVPPDGGTMKTKIGITSPLVLDAPETGLMRLPYFVERNFRIAGNCSFPTWLEADRSMLPLTDLKEMEADLSDQQRYVLRGTLTKDYLVAPYAVRVERDPAATMAWTHDTRSGKIVQSRIEPQPAERPEHLVVVVDGSRRMADHRDAIARALGRLQSSTELTVLVASDTVRTLEAESGEMEKTIRKIPFSGGCDNVPALLVAWGIASKRKGSAILWLHATQPVEMSNSGSLVQAWDRYPTRPAIYDMQFGEGPNQVLKQLYDVADVKRVYDFGHPEAALDRLFGAWSGNRVPLGLTYSVIDTNNDLFPGARASDHLARLWAFNRVNELTESNRDEAVRLAMDHRLITRVTGAVVLETQQQYANAGLEPVDKSSVPSMAAPEPDTFIYLVLGFGLAMRVLRGKRRG
ncbi:MAG: VIT domain-containing protein, partial [Verrucomicrobiota bacterium]